MLKHLNDLVERKEGNKIPIPVYKETKQHFISRAIDYFVRMEKIPLKEAQGRAYGFWKTYSKKETK